MKLPYLSEEELIKVLKTNNLFTPLIEKALKQAKKSHSMQKHAVGTPYLEEHIYPITVSLIDCLAPQKPSENLLAAALLHDVLEDDPGLTRSSFTEDFGGQILAIVEPLTKEKHENHTNLPQQEKMTINAKMISRLKSAPYESKLIKLADRYNNLSCVFAIRESQPERYKRVLKETMELHLPLAQKTSPYFYHLYLKKLKEYEELP